MLYSRPSVFRKYSSLLGAFLGKTAPENPPIPLNSLFPDHSTDSEDSADELDDFCFMILKEL
jgi:hypothetical protein